VGRVISIQLLFWLIHNVRFISVIDNLFQYNSCFCLSQEQYVGSGQNMLFQYNSCFCLSFLKGLGLSQEVIFQYNSCFCLSGKEKTVPYGDYNFNTTLVFVYLNCECGRQWLQAFQYNSCFCLSFWDIAKTEMENLFQYNSCFCLSNAFKPFFFFIIASFPDKINVLHDFSQPFSIFLLFLRISLLSAILSGSSAFLHIQRLGNSDVI
jgi:hypothetical protein